MSASFSKISNEYFENIKDPSKKLWSDIFCMLVVVVIYFFCAFIVPDFFYEVVEIKGVSMLPTLQPTEMTNGNKVGILKTKKVKYGDIVVIDARDFDLSGETEFIIKRVIALEGDTVWIQFNEAAGEHRVYRSSVIDGETVTIVLDEPYINEEMNGATGKYTVNKGCIFVMGDNRNNSTDSRSRAIGEIPLKKILGKGIRLLTKTKSFKLFGRESGWFNSEWIKNPFAN